jgi:protein phosphatase
LCTNGLTDVVSLDDIAATLSLQRRPEDDCQRLIELATAARGVDDVTVLVADYQLH